MPGTGWPVRFAIAVLFVLIVLVAVGLGWMKPGLFFYIATSVVGLLVWLDYRFNRGAPPPKDHAEAAETTVPDVRESDGRVP